MDRSEILSTLRQQPEVSVLIVGAGINGIGVFRELACQGVDVLLVDKGDFCSGASAASSHMAHGGIRYLENAEFRLVREALQERNRLLKNAPHLVKPLPTIIPIFKWFSGTLNAPLKFLGLTDKPRERGAFIIKMGLMMYDLFARGPQRPGRHHFKMRKKSLEERPDLNPDIVCTASYYDAWIAVPERLCVELILDTEALSDTARAVNYLSLAEGQGDTVTLRDELSGETVEVKPKMVVNAAGPWIDFANRAMGRDSRMIGGTKGSHLVIDHPHLLQATGGGEIFFENNDGRIVLFFPLKDRVLAGTTDIRIDNPDEARCTDEEVDYILGMLGRVLPGIKVDRSHIVFRFSGVRPLPHSDTSRTGQISRDHSCVLTEPDSQIHFPTYSLVGGKWTTFRAFSEQVADRLLEGLGRSRKVDTYEMPIGGGKDYPPTEAARGRFLESLHKETGLSQERLITLFDRYGTRASEIGAFLVQEDDAPLENKPDFSRREIIFLTQREKVVHLDDLLLRRSLLAMLGHANRALLEEIAGIMGGVLGWKKKETAEEIKRAAQILLDHHAVEV